MKTRLISLTTGFVILFSLLAIVLITFKANTPPNVVPASAAENTFSAERAAEHLMHIASEPNPIGSKANDIVRQYIIEQLEIMELSPQIHQTEMYYSQRAATVKNVMVRIPGTGDGQAILFMGHYDTVIGAPGASDNGAAVVTLLEVIRMLKHYPQLKNDLIFLFPDGEEYGLLGAQAFMDEHPWKDDIALVVNFEAMGTSGQSIMFETGENNLAVVREYAKAAPHPVGYSLSYEIYKRMRNATDFDVFKYEGYQGLNFAYIGDSFNYHTAGDNIENTDLRSIQHHGSHAASVALHFGNLNLNLTSNQNAVYFNIIGYKFIVYPYSWAPYIAIIILIMTIGIIAYAIYSKRVNPLRMFFGFISFGIFLLILYGLFDAVYGIISSYYTGADFRLIQYHQQGILLGFIILAASFSMAYYYALERGVKPWQIIAFLISAILLLWWAGNINLIRIAIVMAVSAWFYFLHRKPTHVNELWIGAIILWAIVTILVSFVTPGASYLIAWPLLFSLIPLIVTIYKGGIENYKLQISVLLVIFSFPLVSWFPSIIHLFQLAMGVDMISYTIIVAGLMFGLLIPHFYLVTREKPWLFTSLMLIIGLSILLKNTISLDYNEQHRKANLISLATDGATGKSYWIAQHDSWTEQFITKSPDTIYLNKFYPHFDGWQLGKEVDIQTPENPILEVLSDSIKNGERLVKIHVCSQNNPAQFYFYINTGNTVAAIKLENLEKDNLRFLGDTNWQWFFYLAPPDEGITFSIYTEIGQEIILHLNENNFSGLPEFVQHTPRPSNIMSRGDRTMISNRYEI